MRVLLDTHVLIWLVEGNKNLSTVARSAIEDENNSLYLSIVSLWEITIKLSLGKLDLQLSVDEMVESFLIPAVGNKIIVTLRITSRRASANEMTIRIIDTPRPEGTGILSSTTHLAITGLHQRQ